MAVATTRTIALQGGVGHLIDVEVDVSQGMVTTILVGRLDAALSEARDRCRMAVNNSGFGWPTTRRTTILLSPADLPKRGTHFDLAIAVGVIAASIDPRTEPAIPTENAVFIGELGLSGALRPTTGVLPMVMAAAHSGIARVFVPEPQAAEAALVPGMAVFGVRSVAQVIALLRGEEPPEAPPVVAASATSVLAWQGSERVGESDMSDLVGIPDAVYAAEVAAAGGHHLLLRGAKGAGKTSLAERMPGILPDLEPSEALELAAVSSLAGCLPASAVLPTRPPYAAPHHGASAASLLGGGSGRVRPGAISRAHHGILFLDEFPLFATDVVEALRQPLESGEVTIARGEEVATFPARGMVVLAANPCPCGAGAGGLGRSRCQCATTRLRIYQSKLDGPLADRIDIVRDLLPPSPGVRDAAEATTTIRSRVAAARHLQRTRFDGCSWRLNAHVPAAVLRERWPLTAEGEAVIEAQVANGSLTRRGAVRVHRLAWTVADLHRLGEADGGAADEPPDTDEVSTALALRLGQPVTGLAWRRRAGALR